MILEAYTNKKASIVFAALNVVMIAINILIITKTLPFNIIGGGRLKDHESAVVMTAASSFILVIETLFVFFVLFLNLKGKTNFAIKITLWFILVQFIANTILNILGKTLFEKIAMTILCIPQIINMVVILRANATAKKDYLINLIRNEAKR